MQSFLITSTNTDKQSEAIDTLLLAFAIDPLDRTVIAHDGSIGIKEVRLFQEKLFLRPFKGTTKAIILKDAQHLTIEAQNAMLKMLEEPPLHTIIILAATAKEDLLPTIQSRCKIIHVLQQQPAVDQEKAEQTHALLKQLPTMHIGEKLTLAQNYGKTKEDAQQWLYELILETRRLISSYVNAGESAISPSLIQLKHYLIAFHTTYKSLSILNINPRLSLEHLLLSLN